MRRTSAKIKILEHKFLRRLKPVHKHFSKSVFHRLMKKSSTLRSSLKKRSKEYNVTFNITLEEIREKFYRAYNRQCRYCNCKLTVKNMVCDHIKPISNGGNSTSINLQMICKRCNIRKGHLPHSDFIKILRWLSKQSKILSEYVLRKMSKGGKF